MGGSDMSPTFLPRRGEASPSSPSTVSLRTTRSGITPIHQFVDRDTVREFGAVYGHYAGW